MKAILPDIWRLASTWGNSEAYGEQRGRDGEPECYRAAHVHDEFKFNRLFDGEIAWFHSLQDLVDLACRAPIKIVETCSVGQQPAASTISLSP